MKKVLFLLVFIPLVSFGQLTIETKFNPPEGYERVYNDDYSKFLRNFPLKKDNIVKLYDGTNKDNYSFEYNTEIWAAVLDYDIGTADLHQCADAVLYMRANYLYKQGLTKNLQFNFVSGFTANYLDYLTHYYKVEGNKVSLVPRNNILEDNSETLRKWLRQIWMYSNTWSIDKMDSYEVYLDDIKPGDFFIRSNPPPGVGHAINVVDVAVHPMGWKVVMLSQSYMPAQETHILINPLEGGVWYTIDSTTKIIATPEFTFYQTELKRFIN
jgi:hypothetical protein